jgi:hypothetical protein
LGELKLVLIFLMWHLFMPLIHNGEKWRVMGDNFWRLIKLQNLTCQMKYFCINLDSKNCARHFVSWSISKKLYCTYHYHTSFFPILWSITVRWLMSILISC